MKKKEIMFSDLKKDFSTEKIQELGSVMSSHLLGASGEQIVAKERETFYQNFLKDLYKKKGVEREERKIPEIKKQAQKIFSWFQKSSQRMLVGITAAWILFIILIFSTLVLMSGDFSFSEILTFYIMFLISGIGGGYFYGYFIAIITPNLVSRLFKKDNISWIRFTLGIFIWFFYLIYGLLPRKAFEWYFYKFTKLYKGINLYREEKYQEAISELQLYMPQKGDKEENFIYYSALGECYFELGQISHAIDCYQRAINFAPDDVEAKVNLGSLYILNNQHDEALSLLRELHIKYPENTQILIAMARSYLILEMFDEAIDILLKARALKPMDPIIYKMLAEAYLGKGMNKDALELASKAISLNPPSEIKEEAQEIINYLQKN